MLKNLTITATLNQIILLKTATLNYFLVLWLRRTILLCGSFAESENFHIVAMPFLPLVLRLRRTRIYLLLDLIQIPVTPLLSSLVSCRMISSTATPLYSCLLPLAVPPYSTRHITHTRVWARSQPCLKAYALPRYARTADWFKWGSPP